MSCAIWVTRPRYVDLLLQTVVKLWRSGFGDYFLFMKDSASPHTCRVSKNVFETGGVTVFKWPSCFPDLNAIPSCETGWKEK